MKKLKQLQFVNGAAQDETRELPLAIRKSIGFQLLRVQRGEMPEDFKPMKTVGEGVYEIRADDEHGNKVGRCFYVAKFGDTVWVLHSYVKKARKTPKNDLEIGNKRYKELLKRIERG
jgi:phage-related protein